MEYLGRLALGTFVPMLKSLSAILVRGAEHAASRHRDVAEFVNTRLAPDMYTMGHQVRLACRFACEGVAYPRGAQPITFDRTGQSFEELQAQISRTLGHLEALDPVSFEGAGERAFEVPLAEGVVLAVNGFEFLRDWAIPHFYFHVVTTYDILRHNGVQIGKMDYLAHVGRYVRPRASTAPVDRSLK